MIKQLIISYLLIISISLPAQNHLSSKKDKVKQIQILHADMLKYNKSMNANRLIGNVICQHENTFFYFDSAYLYPNQSLKAFGNIRIVSDSLTITAENLNYDANSKWASLENNVLCQDNQMSLKTNILQYNTTSHLAYYPNKSEIIRKNHRLTSDKGYYYSKDKILAFKNNVSLTNPDYTIKTDTLLYYVYTDIAYFNAPTIILMDSDYLYCEKGWYDTKNKKAYFSKKPLLFSDKKKLYADSIFYNENTNEGKAYQNIRLIDTAQKSIITGQFATYQIKNEKAMITKNPVLMKLHNNSKDTILIRADTLFYEKSDSNIIARCSNNSQLFHPQFQASAKYIIYYQKDSIIHFIQSPTFWFQNNQASSKYARLYLKKNGIDKIILDTNVIIVQEADSIYHNKFNQISGRKMHLHFQNDSIKNTIVDGNAQVYYFVKNDQNKWTGLNKAKCSKIRIDFLNNNIHKISFIDHPETIIIPIKKIQAEKEKLPHFTWQPHLRPTKNQFFQ